MSDLVKRLVARYRKQAGAVDFFTYAAGSDPRKAFSEAVQEARYESGHGGYTGTIAEKGSFVIRNRELRSKDEAYAYAQEDADRNDKWGPAWAIPVVESKDLGDKDLVIQFAAGSEQEAYAQARKPEVVLKGKLKPGVGYTIQVLKVTMVKPAGVPDFEEVPPPAGMDKPWFRVRSTAHGQWAPTHNTVLTTKPAANAELKRALALAQPGVTFLVEKVQTLGSFRVKALSGKQATWEASVRVKQSQRGTNITGWLFYGMASS